MAVRVTGRPVASEVGYAAAPSAWTPITRTSGRPCSRHISLIAVAEPATRPPPPSGISTVSTSGACSMISSPQVPCPATMSSWSKGWISTAPVSAENRSASSSDWSRYAPWKTTSAPYPRVAFSLGIGAPSGMNTVALIPSSWAASATPCAWLPADAATTPRARSSSVSRSIRT